MLIKLKKREKEIGYLLRMKVKRERVLNKTKFTAETHGNID